MAEIIAFCGINCVECPAYIATKTNDDALRRQTAKEWSKEFNAEIKPQDINCVGCTISEGQHIGYCAMCEIRACALKKKVKNCAYCEEYACAGLAKFHEKATNAKTKLAETRKTLKK